MRRAAPSDDVVVTAIGTALPRHRLPQAEAARLYATAFAPDDPARALVRRAFRAAGVRSRRTCVPMLPADATGSLLARPGPGTAARMALYAAHAPELAARAARKALRAGAVAPRQVDHLVVATCTGFAAPGVDVALLARLGLRDDVERTLVGFMGCHGAFNALRVARAAAAEGRTVLVVCVELCSLHACTEPTRDALVASALFGDAAAAAVVTRAVSGAPALVRLGRGVSRVVHDDGACMAWEIGDHGFRMRLADVLPERIAAEVHDVVAPLRSPDGGDAWCVHPGGPAILDGVARALGLAPDALAASRAVLRAHGNVSSATILFVLQRAARTLAPGAPGILLGFGPGLTLEALRFVRGARAAPAGAASAARAPAAPRPRT